MVTAAFNSTEAKEDEDGTVPRARADHCKLLSVDSVNGERQVGSFLGKMGSTWFFSRG